MTAVAVTVRIVFDDPGPVGPRSGVDHLDQSAVEKLFDAHQVVLARPVEEDRHVPPGRADSPVEVPGVPTQLDAALGVPRP